MPLSDIIFQKGQGGLGRPLSGQDFISGLCFYSNSLPAGFSPANRIKQLFSVSDAVNAGILNDNSDAVAPTFQYLITASGSVGDTINCTITVASGKVINLGTYKKVAGDSTITLLGTSIASAINGGTITHGYSAAFANAIVTVTGTLDTGVYLNSAVLPVAITIVGTIAGTLSQPTGGVASKLAVYYYHIAEYFRLQPKGSLYVGFFAITSPYTFQEISTIQNFANGSIRQVGIFKDSASAFAVGDITLIDLVCKANDSLHKPLSALYAADLSATVDISVLTDLNLLTASKCSAVIGQDGAGQGNALFLATGKSITILGALLGTVSLSKVSESVAWVGQYNISNGIECEVLAFANGQQFNAAAISDNLLQSLDAKRYVFLRKYVGAAGSYFNGGHAAVSITSDYAYIENNRTIDKATRGIYASLLPSLNSPLRLNADGSLRETTTAFLESQAEINLNQMVRDGELSAHKVSINPAQNVLSTNQIIIAVTMVINGIARFIIVPIGFKPSIV